MAKFSKIRQDNPEIEEYLLECPGCKCAHAVRVKGPRPCWTWNGDIEKPTISPSLLVDQNNPEHRCHSFIRDGRIQFLDDCGHRLAGQAVRIPDWDEEEESGDGE